jgi:hypothetical protein
MGQGASYKVIGTLSLFVGLAMAGSPQANAGPSSGPTSVEVVNPATSPVPVTGAVSVSSMPGVNVSGTVNIGNSPGVNLLGTPTVQAQQAGAWNVGLTGSPAVTLAPAQPTTFTIVVTLSENSNGGVTYLSVPAGQRLIIESIGGIAYSTTPGQGFAITVQAGGALGASPPFASTSVRAMGSATVALTPFTQNGITRYSATQQVRMYADPNSSILAQVDSQQLISTYEAGEGGSVTISGYLVPAP